MIFKILTFLIAIFLIYILFFKKNREDVIKKNKEIEEEDLFVQCGGCQTFVSKSDAIISNGKYFCTKECVK